MHGTLRTCLHSPFSIARLFSVPRSLRDQLLLHRRLLLTDTVERSESPYEIDTVDADHCAVRELRLDDIERFQVVRMIEDRDDDESVADQEVRVGLPGSLCPS
jgi:hypothetical protein